MTETWRVTYFDPLHWCVNACMYFYRDNTDTLVLRLLEDAVYCELRIIFKYR